MSEKSCGAYFFAFFEKFVAPILTSGGYVGLSIATLLSQHHKVTAVDIIPEKVELINNKKSPIQDDYIEKYLAEKELDLTATLDAKKAYSDADFVVIAAPTTPLSALVSTHHPKPCKIHHIDTPIASDTFLHRYIHFINNGNTRAKHVNI